MKDPTYKKVKCDPTTKIKKHFTVTERSDEEWMDPKLRLYVTLQFSIPPQIYGLPKIHKARTPLRLIVSSIRSPTYKELARILAPLMEKTDTFIKNFAEFIKDIRKTRRRGYNHGQL